MKRSKVFEQILNGLVLLGILAIIIVASIELLDGNNALSEAFILKFHLWVCGLFLSDFFVRWYTDGWTGRFFNHNLFFLLVSIPYLNIVYGLSTTISHSTWLILRLIPLARGIYGVSLIVSWMTRSRITNLFATYLTILFTTIYFCTSFSPTWNTVLTLPWKHTGTLSTGRWWTLPRLGRIFSGSRRLGKSLPSFSPPRVWFFSRYSPLTSRQYSSEKEKKRTARPMNKRPFRLTACAVFYNFRCGSLFLLQINWLEIRKSCAR